MSKIEVDAIDKQSGSTLTLGGSGTAVTLACGATQTGFGRTGTVNWDTTAKTGDFTAVSGNGYFVNTTSGAITVTLPASPSGGDIVAVKDYADTFDTNAVTLARNGSNIGGQALNSVLSVEGLAVTLVYVDATKGWLVTDSGLQSEAPGPQYITATGGTITCSGDYKIHTFTGPGTFCVSAGGNVAGSNTVDYLVIAGGGGGGSTHGGGGGAGGYRESSGTTSGCYTASPLGACVSALPVSVQGYPIVVGGGGAFSPSPGGLKGVSGSDSSFSIRTATGGGGGARGCSDTRMDGLPGGSGSGSATGCSASTRGAIGSGNTPPVNPSQGNNGGQGASDTTSYRSGGGGGGATADGTSSSPSGEIATPGGAGATSSINGTPTARAGGGGGGSSNAPGTGAGGTGGGGAGGHNCTPNPGRNATTNTGGGGGGSGGSASDVGGTGGSGIVIIRYKFQ